MRQSQLFTKTRREGPSDEESKNAQLLIKAGFMNKEMAGVYDYLPLGLQVLKKIENIIREEMNAIGGQEVLMSTLQRKELWKRQGRWETMDNWFKSTFKNGGEVGMASTHEEPVANMLEQFVSSHKDLPFYVYQFQTKFRNEERAKSGIMRTKEFLMKDLYSFSRTEEEFKEFYERCAEAYMKIFSRVGLGDITYRTVAAGGNFTTETTDEFQTLSETGEDTIYIDENKKLAVNKEVYNEKIIEKFGLNKDQLKESKSVEVGNIFPLGTKYSDPYLKFKDASGEEKHVVMGSYGIGLGRLMGTVVETLSDDKGIVWPREISPFDIHLVEIAGNKPEIKEKTEEIYKKLSRKYTVLYDDRDVRAGEKFTDADLMGITNQIIVGEKSLENKTVELKHRKTGEVKNVTVDEISLEMLV